MRRALFVAAIALGLSQAAWAANANAPYSNVDRRVDAGNDTGDWQVDRLNAQQLERNYRGPYYPAPPAYRPLLPQLSPYPYAPPPYYRPVYPPRY